METETEAGLREVLQFFEDGKAEQAQKVITHLFEIDLDSREVAYCNR